MNHSPKFSNSLLFLALVEWFNSEIISFFSQAASDLVEIAADCQLIENLLHVISLIEDIEPIDSTVDDLRSEKSLASG